MLEQQAGTILLDSSLADGLQRASYFFSHPLKVIHADSLAEVPQALGELDEAVAAGYYVAGYMAYEMGYAFEAIAPVGAVRHPLLWFGVYAEPLVLEEDAVAEHLGLIEEASFSVKHTRLGISREAYCEALQAIKTLIRDGEVYQINFTDRISFDFEGSPLAFYSQLRRRQRVAWGAYLNTGETHLLSLSPELFFQREGSRIWTRPMKGTHRRGRTRAEDVALQDALVADAKNRAENLMIVDLLRNDLSRCCIPGSVQVPELFTTEVYETLIQMTSTVEGHLREGIRYADIFRALFPCGSVTGTPKISAMQHIDALEAAPRGVYCGAIGYIAPDDRAAFNVAIRTAVIENGRGTMGTGSGIVWDSDPNSEYEETLLKAQFLTQAAVPTTAPPDFQLIETMLAEDGDIALFDLHADRLQESALYFRFDFDRALFNKRVHDVLLTLPAGRHKVRTTLDRRGAIAVTTTLLPDTFPAYSQVCYSTQRVDSRDPFFYHKTTRRAMYESEYASARAAGFAEILFLNERGEVSEGARSTVFIAVGEALYTPPLTSGLLNGVYRQHLLQTRPQTYERVLFPDDLERADAVYLSNAVRGLQRVQKVVPRSLGDDLAVSS